MTLVISTLTSSGIVLTADSRQTYKNQAGVVRIGSDSAMKLFKLTPRCGAAIAGRAFINEDGQPFKDVGFFIRRFASNENLEKLSIKEIAEKLNEHLANIFVRREKQSMANVIADHIGKQGGTELHIQPTDDHLLPYTFRSKDGEQKRDTGSIDTVQMIVAGIDTDGVGRSYMLSIPKGISLEKNTQECGAMWIGQTDVVSRIVKGHAPELRNLRFVNDALVQPRSDAQNQLNGLEYIINWSIITLQDAVDFGVLMTRTTESIQRFSDGTAQTPGGITGVGGSIDVAVITPDNGFNWLRRKSLVAEGSSLSLSDFKDETQPNP